MFQELLVRRVVVDSHWPGVKGAREMRRGANMPGVGRGGSEEAWVEEAWDTTEAESPGTNGQLASMGERRKPALGSQRKLRMPCAE